MRAITEQECRTCGCRGQRGRLSGPERLFTLQEAAELTSFSVDTMRRAIHTTDPRSFPPPLYAKRAGSGGKFLILQSELTRWMHDLPDA
jgi:hypothetical protein